MKKLISIMLCLALMLSMGLSAHAGVLDQLIKQMEQSKTGQTDATTSASQKPAGKQEHISLGIKIPSLESFCGRELNVAFYDELENYTHIIYDSYVSEDELDEYMEHLEDEYDFRLAIYDWKRGIYGYDYFEADVWTMYPGYGYKDEDDVAFMIVSDGDNTHVYHSIDFDYCRMQSKSPGLDNYEKFLAQQDEELEKAVLRRRNSSDIELPDFERFFPEAVLKKSSEALCESYSHICYETEYDFDDIEAYVELLEEEYGLRRVYPKDYPLNEGEYCFSYTGKGKVETFRPEYYVLPMDVAVFIANYPKYAHIYFSNDFNYDYWGDCFEEIDAVTSASRK